MTISSVFLIGFSFICGIYFHICLEFFRNRIKNNKIFKENTKQFNEILKNLKNDKSKFTNRVNDTIFIETFLTDFDYVSIVYMLDKDEVYIFKEDKCLYTCKSIDDDLREEVIDEINLRHHNEIDDIIEVMGTKISKSEFESKMNNIKSMDISELNLDLNNESDNEIDKIINENDTKLDLDEILDKLSKNNFDREQLSDDEINFLDKISKE